MPRRPSCRRVALAWVVIAAATLAAPRAAQAGPEYELALAAYDRVEYPETVRHLERALPSEPLTQSELERAYFLLGSSLLGDGQIDRADRAFRTLIALRPDYRGEASPKVNEALRRARVAIGPLTPRIVPDPAPAVGRGDVVVVTADMSGPDVLSPAVEYRVAGDAGPPARVRVRCEGARCEARLPAETASYRLGFLTPEGAFALPTGELRPLSRRAVVAAAASGPRTPVYKKWWLWTIVGVAVVGGAAGLAAGLTLQQRAAHSVDFSIRKDCGGSAICPLWSTP